MNPRSGVGGPETAVLAGGCFWCLEAVFGELNGVLSVDSGFSGGGPEAPRYEDVCSGRTRHAEAVRVVFDPAILSYRDLLEVFFAVHDPTTPDRQGADVGPQYRSAIFARNSEQDATARAVRAEIEAEKIFAAPVVTEVTAFTAFHPADARHRNYFLDHPDQPYCRAVISPKMAKFRARFASRLKRR